MHNHIFLLTHSIKINTINTTVHLRPFVAFVGLLEVFEIYIAVSNALYIVGYACYTHELLYSIVSF